MGKKLNAAKNPFIVLGVPYGANVKEATQALARKTSFLNRDEGVGCAKEELTSALHAIETAEGEHSGVYRLPSSSEILKPKFNINMYEVEGDGVVLVDDVLVEDDSVDRSYYAVVEDSAGGHPDSDGESANMDMVAFILVGVAILATSIVLSSFS